MGQRLDDEPRGDGRFWRPGIPWRPLMLTSINHPGARGLKIFGDALLKLFP